MPALKDGASSMGTSSVHDSPPQFFVNQKRGEISELRALLKSLPPDNPDMPQNRVRRREVLKRLIAYMTLGIDVSPVFPDVVLASATTDPVQKKLLTLYLSNYAELNADVSILAINALQKDLRDVDPRIRGLALKALTSLRVDSVAEYAEKAVREGLNDSSSYVRRSAIVGVLKLMTADWATDLLVADSRNSLLAAVRKNLLSVDPQLFVNALLVLNECKKGFHADRRIVVNLFNKMDNCDIFGRTLILCMLANFTPKDSKEMLALIEALEKQLIMTSPSIVLTTLKVMLSMAKSQLDHSPHLVSKDENQLNSPTAEDQHDWTQYRLIRSCLERARPALLTLLSSSSLESNFAVLISIQQIVRSSKDFAQIFANDWPVLAPRFSDKTYNQFIRLSLIDNITNDENWMGIQQAVQTFLSPPGAVDALVLRNSLRVLGNIALKVPHASNDILLELLAMYQLELPSVCSAIMPVFSAILSQYPKLADEVLPFIGQTISHSSLDMEACRAFVWMAGEFPTSAPYAPELFLGLIESIFEADVELDSLDLASDCSMGPQLTSSEKVLPSSEFSAVKDVKFVLMSELLAACCKVLFVDPVGIKEPLAILLHKMDDISALPADTKDRLGVVKLLLTSRQDCLPIFFGPESMGGHKRPRHVSGSLTLRTTDLPRLPISKLNSIAATTSVPMSMENVLPFGISPC